MTVHHVRRGLDLPIAGAPVQAIVDSPEVRRVALVTADYAGLSPRVEVSEGDVVRAGDPLMSDRRADGVRHGAPGSGRVAAILRGERRSVQAVVIEVQDDGATSGRWTAGSESSDAVRRALQDSGLWTALRTRPFSRVPRRGETPRSLFVTAIDTEPLAPDVSVVLEGRQDDFAAGLRALASLCPGTTYVCKSPGTQLETAGCPVRVEEFAGVHPAGTVGLHIHRLDPVCRGKTAWHVGYQDVIAVGHLMRTGQLDLGRVVSLAGPGVRRPRLIRTRIGAALDELVAGELLAGEQRVVSGSLLAGRHASGPRGHLGRYHRQVCALPEGRRRELLGWLRPGPGRHSVLRAFAGLWSPRGREFDWTTSTHGSPRALVPLGTYERVMPLDLMPTHLLRALAACDTEWAEELGALELDEEDLALCSYVCPGKADHGAHLRRVLDRLAGDSAT